MVRREDREQPPGAADDGQASRGQGAVPAGALIVLATLTARPGRRKELVAAARRNAEQSLALEAGGCLLFLVVEDAEDEEVLRFVSAFQDEAAFDRHRRMPHFQAWREESAELLETEPPIRHRRGVAV